MRTGRLIRRTIFSRRQWVQLELALRPIVIVEEGSPLNDLVVLASGLNSGSVEISGVNYRPPASRAMSQDELYAREEDKQEHFGSSVCACLLPETDLIFGSVVTKESFLDVSLLSGGGPADLDDNELGRFIFAIHSRAKGPGRYFRARSRLMNPEGSKSVAGQAFNRILWGM